MGISLLMFSLRIKYFQDNRYNNTQKSLTLFTKTTRRGTQKEKTVECE